MQNHVAKNQSQHRGYGRKHSFDPHPRFFSSAQNLSRTQSGLSTIIQVYAQKFSKQNIGYLLKYDKLPGPMFFSSADGAFFVMFFWACFILLHRRCRGNRCLLETS